MSKMLSFESPGTPESFSFKKWEPKVDLNLTNSQTHIWMVIFMKQCFV